MNAAAQVGPADAGKGVLRTRTSAPVDGVQLQAGDRVVEEVGRVEIDAKGVLNRDAGGSRAGRNCAGTGGRKCAAVGCDGEGRHRVGVVVRNVQELAARIDGDAARLRLRRKWAGGNRRRDAARAHAVRNDLVAGVVGDIEEVAERAQRRARWRECPSGYPVEVPAPAAMVVLPMAVTARRNSGHDLKASRLFVVLPS